MLGTKVNITKAKKMMEKGAILIDTRTPIDFRDGTISGAINITIGNVSKLITYKPDSKLIFFGKDDENLKIVMNYASQRFSTIYILDDYEKWV